MFGENFPYTNFHDLNMDWIIKIAKDFLDQYTNIQNIITEGLEDLEEKTNEGVEALNDLYTNLSDLLQQWYNTHSEDIANQLASALVDLNAWYTLHENYLDQTLADNISAFNTAAESKATITIASIPDDYTTLSNNVNALKNELNEYVAQLEYSSSYGSILIDSKFELGGWQNTDVGQVPSRFSNNERARYIWSAMVGSHNYIITPPTGYNVGVIQLTDEGVVLSDSGWKNSSYTFTSNSNAKLFILTFKTSTSAVISDITPLKATTLIMDSELKNLSNRIEEVDDDLNSFEMTSRFGNILSSTKFELGGWQNTDVGQTPSRYTTNERARYIWSKMFPSMKYKITPPAGYSVSIMQLTSNGVVLSDSGWKNSTYEFTSENDAMQFLLTFKTSTSAVISDLTDVIKTSMILYSELEQTIEQMNTKDLQVFGKFFSQAHIAWGKSNFYEAWPYGNVIIHNGLLKTFYNSRDEHVDYHNGDVLMRYKTELGHFSEPIIVAEHGTYSYQTHGVCVLPNNNILCIATEQANDSQQDGGNFRKFVSADGGNTWSDAGLVTVNDTPVYDECMSSLFCMSNGNLVSYLGSINEKKVIASFDNGNTWQFVYTPTNNTGTLEATFIEIGNKLWMVLRHNGTGPSVHKCDLDLTNWEQVYSAGSFFSSVSNPTSVIKLPDNKIYILGGSRSLDSMGNGSLFEVVCTEEQFTNNNFSEYRILKSYPVRSNDYFYAQAVCFPDNIVYAYFYLSKNTGKPYIYEMIGRYIG